MALDGATIDQITQAIEQICGPLDNIVPGATHACELLIETQLPQIIDYLLNHQLSPTAICQQLKGQKLRHFKKDSKTIISSGGTFVMKLNVKSLSKYGESRYFTRY